MPNQLQFGTTKFGIEIRYPLERIYEEVAFIAFHFHWSREEIMSMPHNERQRWCNEISKINHKRMDGKKDTKNLF